MSQHVTQTCSESSGLWLPLIEYSLKSGLSLSTIRRKIKSNSIPYKLDKGRYLILFGEDSVTVPTATAPTAASAAFEPVEIPESMTDRAVTMVSDAFEHALKEKDERIRLLEKRNTELSDRVEELQHLVRVLEERYGVRY